MQPSTAGIQQSAIIQKQLSDMHVDLWLKEDLLHVHWWILIGLDCVLVATWFLLLRREGLRETCLYAAVMAVFALGLEEYGEELILWDYPTDIIPYFPPLTSVNLLLLPLAFSILHQRCRTWKRFLWAALIASAAVSLVAEPLLAYGKLYELVNWEHYFSLPAYYILALVTRFVTVKIAAVSERYCRQA
jgi:hypothetical protein